MTDDFEHGQTTTPDATSVDALARKIDELLTAIRSLPKMVTEDALIERLAAELRRQNQTTTELMRLFRELHHTLQWLHKHVGALHLVLAKIIEVEDPPKPG